MSQRIIWLSLAPMLLVLGGLFGGGLLAGLARSFNYMPVIGLTEPDLSAWRAALGSPAFLASLGLSLRIAVIATLAALCLGLAAALLLRQSFPGQRLISFLVRLNLTVPHVVGAIGILYLVSQSGSLARLAHHAGLITAPAQFPILVNDPEGIGIILHYVWKEVPFVTLILLAALARLPPGYEAIARSMGASRWQTFIRVLLPLLTPALTVAAAIVFAFTFGAYEIPLLLGAHAPAALPVLAYRSYTATDLAARPEAMAMAIVIAVISAALILLALKAARVALRRAS
jgi:putative spermidine/putrescine transport system permease protein